MTHGTLVGVADDGACYCLPCAPAAVGTPTLATALATAEDRGTGGALLAGFEYDAPVALRDPRTFFADPDDLADFWAAGFTHLGVVPPPTCRRCGDGIPGGQPLPIWGGDYVPASAVVDACGGSLIVQW